MSFLNHLISGVSLGSIYAIIALGYTMVHGIAKMLNFAHGDVIMVGGYKACATSYLGWPAWMGVVLRGRRRTVLGVVIERLAWLYKPPRRRRTRSPPSVCPISSRTRRSSSGPPTRRALTGRHRRRALSLAVSSRFSRDPRHRVRLRRYHGRAHAVHRQEQRSARRCVRFEDKGAAQLMGINVNTTIHHFRHRLRPCGDCRRAALLRIPDSDADDRLSPGIKAFTAAVFGGIGFPSPRLSAACCLASSRSFAKAYISTQLSDAIVFGVLIVVLLVKPDGLLGKRTSEKV